MIDTNVGECSGIWSYLSFPLSLSLTFLSLFQIIKNKPNSSEKCFKSFHMLILPTYHLRTSELIDSLQMLSREFTFANC